MVIINMIKTMIIKKLILTIVFGKPWLTPVLPLLSHEFHKCISDLKSQPHMSDFK